MPTKRIKDLVMNKYTGYAVIDDEDGTGKFPLDDLIANFAKKFSTSTPYSAGDIVTHLGKLYRFKVDHPAGVWNAAHVDSIDIEQIINESNSVLHSVISVGQKAVIELYNTSQDTTLDEDGNAIPLEGSTLYRYSLEDNSSGVVYVNDGFCVFASGPSASTRVSGRLPSGYHVVPTSANYILCASTSESKAYNVNFEESATKQGLDEVSSTADTALVIGTTAASVANEAVLDVIAIASKDVALEYYNTSPQSDIQPDGTAGSNVNSYIARYDVQQYVGRRLCITTDDGYCFSASTSAVDHITAKLYSKTIEVPSGANVLLVSASNDTNIDVFVIEESARKTAVLEIENNVLELENDVGRIEREAMHFSDPLPAKNTSASNRIKDDGSVEANAGYYLIRYNVAPFVGKKLQIDSNYNYCFSTSDSASGHITAGLRDNIVQVPTGAVTLIVSSTTGYPINCREVNPVSKYGQFGIQFRSTMIFSQRVGDAVGLNFSIDAETGTAVSDFDKCYPWCDMRLCNIANPAGARSVVYEGETGFSYAADTFVEVPKFYFKRSYDSVTETETWVISDKGGDGFAVEPWFLDSEGQEVSVRYIARYNLGQNISRTGEVPYIQATFDNLKTKCETAGFSLSDIYAYQAITHLFAVEVGTKDSQSVFPGVSYYRYYADPNANTMQNLSASTNTIVLAPDEDYRNAYFGVGDRVMIFTGSSTAYNEAIFRHLTAVSSNSSGISLTFDGEPISLTQGVSRIYGVSQQNGRTDAISKTCRVVGGDPKTRPFSYRGIENLYGNIGEAVDRIMFDTTNNRLIVDGKHLSFMTPQNSSYVEQLTIPKWVRYFGRDPMYPTLTLPKGSLTDIIDNSYTDEWSTFGSADLLHLVYSCAWDHLNGNGLFCYRALTEVNNQLYSGRAML